MTRILVQRGLGSSSSSTSSSSQNRAALSEAASSTQTRAALPEASSSSGLAPAHPVLQELRILENSTVKPEALNECVQEIGDDEITEKGKGSGSQEDLDSGVEALSGLSIGEVSGGTSQVVSVSGSSHPPPPPVPPPSKPVVTNLSTRRTASGGSNALGIGSSRRAVAWPVVTPKTPPASKPSSPKSEGYNSADEQNPCYGPSFNDAEREQRFEHDIRRAKGFDIKRMLEDGNCLFRAFADQVYGDSEAYDLVRQMCIDYMERERDHFSQFITEGFTSYCKRKRRDKVYGNNAEIQALSEMYNRPIHIYCYSTEPINIFHGSYNTDTPPIRLSYHHGNHYNAVVDPRRLTVGAGLGFSNLQGANVDKDRVKAAIKAQQDQQIDNALIAEGRFYSDLELTEKEIEHMVMEASRSEYLADDKFKHTHGINGSSTSSAETSSSGPSRSDLKGKSGKVGLSNSVQKVLSMGFGYLQVIEAYSIFGDDVDSMVCYLLETCSGQPTYGSHKGKATE